METLRASDIKLCAEVCPDDYTREQCARVCARSGAAAASLRGKLFNVPFRQPREAGLDGETDDQPAWAAVDMTFAKSPWQPARAGSPAAAAATAGAPVRKQQPPATRLHGWGRVPDPLLPPPSFAAAAPVMRRESAEDSPLAGYLLPYTPDENAPAWPQALAGAAVGVAAKAGGFGLSRSARPDPSSQPQGGVMRRRPPNLAS
jgi:hypothetical protein